MRSPSPDLISEADSVETIPASAPAAEGGAPISDTWDSEAPTAVQARHPLFAGPPRLPTT